MSHFLKTYKPLGENGTGGLTPTVSWMQQLPEIIGDHLVIDTAVTALASEYLAFREKIPCLWRRFVIYIPVLYNGFSKSHQPNP